ncbi:MAG: carbohydrate ABC transporter permease [Nocardioidaceae bacterium]
MTAIDDIEGNRSLEVPAVLPQAGRAPSRRQPVGEGHPVGRAITYVLLVAGALLFVAPFAWLISASFQPMSEIFSNPPQWIPQHPTGAGYRQFLNLGHLSGAERSAGTGDLRWFANSAFVAITVTVLQTFFNALAAYVFAKRRFPGRNAIFMMFLATMMVPGQVTLIPNYLVIKHIPLFGGNDILGNGGHGWLDSYWGLIMPGTVSAFGIFLLRQYMMSIPDELLDAARIDGASEFRIFWSVVLPLCMPALAATAIFTFQGAWEDFLWPLIIISSSDHYTAPLGLALFVVKNRTSWNLLFAGSVIATLPMILVFIIFQRKFIQGIALTGVKG